MTSPPRHPRLSFQLAPMKRSSMGLRQWLQLRRPLSSSNPPTPGSRANDFLFPPSAALVTLPTSRNNPSSTRRGFHSTKRQNAQPRKARPAPATRLKRIDPDIDTRLLPDWSGVASRQGVLLHPLYPFVKLSEDEWLKENLRNSQYFYARAIRDGYLSSAVSFETFRDVQAELCISAYLQMPRARTIRAISVDVDAVFRIGYVISTMDKMLREWIISACGMAHARLPVVLTVARQIDWNKMPVRNEWTRQLETFADQGYPPAMVLHAKILGLRNEYNQAFALLEKNVLPFLSPTLRSPVFFEDIVLGGQFESPWRLYALLHARYDLQYHSKENRVKSDEAVRVAAMEYQDADALIEYASLMMNENNLDMYEECMSKAATAGKSNACLFLANFYYLTFHGKYPTRGERAMQGNNWGPESPPEASPGKTKPKAQDPAPSTTSSLPIMNVATSAYKWVSSFFNQSMQRGEYRNLASAWYYLAYRHGESRAAFMMALMAREAGEMAHGRVFLDQAEMEHDLDFAGRLQDLKNHWYDEDYEPVLPKKMLEVR